MTEGEERVCGEPLGYKDGLCDKKPKYDDGKCGYHTEEIEKGDGPGDAVKHGLNQNRGEYFMALPKRDQKWVDAVAEDILEKSYYSWEDPAMVEKCRQIAIDLHQKRRADGYVARKGLTQENTVGFHDEYGEITETQENVLLISKDRLSRESRLAMKDLGVLDQDSGDAGEKAESVIESLSKEAEEDD